MGSYYGRPQDGISFPHPYIGPSSATQHPLPSTVAVGRNADSDPHPVDGGHQAVMEPAHTIHTYNLKEYAFISINSHAGSTHGVPLVYLGEEATGSVVFPEYRLHEVRRIDVVVSWLLSWNPCH